MILLLLTLDPPWKNVNAVEKIDLQSYFTGAFHELNGGTDIFISIFVPKHLKKKLYASLVIPSLLMQLNQSSCVTIVRLVSDDKNNLSCIKKTLENPDIKKKIVQIFQKLSIFVKK